MLPWFHLCLCAVVFGGGSKASAAPSSSYTSRHRALSFSRRSVKERQHFARTAPPIMTIQPFDHQAPASQFSPRVNINATMEGLPFGDGPGVMPAFPVATRDFWYGNGPPVQAWEFLACPIVDPDSFIKDPLSCIFGEDTQGGLEQFLVGAIDKEVVKDFATGIAVPLVVSALIQMTGIGYIARIARFICDIISFVENIIDTVKDIMGIVGGIKDKVFGGLKKGFRKIKKLFGKRRLQSGEEKATFPSCTQEHLQTCETPEGLTDEDCTACLERDEEDLGDLNCEGCSTCFRPLTDTTPAMKGLCLPTVGLREVADDIYVTQFLQTSLLANYMEDVLKTTENTTRRALRQAGENTDDAFEEYNDILEQMRASTNAIVQMTKTASASSNDTSIVEHFAELDAKISSVIQRLDGGVQCKAVDEEMLFEKIKQENEHPASIPFKDLQAAKASVMGQQGSSEEHVHQATNVIEEMLSSFAVNDPLKKIKTDTNEALHQEGILDDLKIGASDYLSLKSPEINEAATDYARKLLDAKFSDARRRLNTSQDASERNLSISENCDEFVDKILDIVRDALTVFAEGVIDGVADFLDDVPDSFKDAANKFQEFSGVLQLPATFFASLDPYDTVVRDIVYTLSTQFRKIAAKLIHGCDDTSDERCIEQLPSLRGRRFKNIVISETRDGQLFLSRGCDRNLVGEFALYDSVGGLIEKLLDVGGDVIPEILNAPVQFLKFIVRAMKKATEHIGSVCGYLGGLVSAATQGAAFENSRLMLREIACIPVDNLLRGHGCDGIDNNCDIGHIRDECDEDIVPPTIDTSEASKICSGKIFTDKASALACIEPLIVAEDDCRPVEVSVTIDVADECNAQAMITARALGCGIREAEDVTVVTIPLMMDEEDPTVALEVGDGQGNFSTELELDDNGEYVNIDLRLLAADNQQRCEWGAPLMIETKVMSNQKAPGETVVVPFDVQPTPGSATRLLADADDHTIPIGFYVLAERCEYGGKGKGSPCLSAYNVDYRTYSIISTVTDGAGRVSTAESTVVIVGKQGKGKGSRQRRLSTNRLDNRVLRNRPSIQQSNSKGKGSPREMQPGQHFLLETVRVSA